jgi:aerobic carbon-monoxide dehydrogenase small subunit
VLGTSSFQVQLRGGLPVKISMTVNSMAQSHDVEPRTLLVQYLREACALTGTNVGCDTSSCGACTIHLDGESAKSCTILAAQADGGTVTTIEGMAAADGTLHPMQEASKSRTAMRLLHAGHGDGSNWAPQGNSTPN